jgi:hypothetical protein
MTLRYPDKRGGGHLFPDAMQESFHANLNHPSWIF